MGDSPIVAAKPYFLFSASASASASPSVCEEVAKHDIVLETMRQSEHGCEALLLGLFLYRFV